MKSDCPQNDCQCDDWPPTECPQCATRIIGATAEDWYRHFDEDCETLGRLYCFVAEPTEGTV